MKKMYISVGLITLGAFTYAQEQRMIKGSSDIILPTQPALSAGLKTQAGCSDTLDNVGTATLAVYRAGTHGFVCGTNDYNDLEKAEWFDPSKYSTITSPKIDGAIVFFYRDTSTGRGTQGNPATAVNLKVYDGTSTAGPTTLLGQVNSNIGAIISAPVVSGIAYVYTYTFSTVVSLPTTGFFASIQIPDGTVAGDTAVIFAASVTTNTAWEKWSDNSWNDFVSSWNAKLSMAIMPIVSCATSVNEPISLSSSIEILGNPSNGISFVKFGNLNSKKDKYTMEVTNVLGQTVLKEEQTFDNVGGFVIDMRNLDNGIYNITIYNSTEKITKKLVLNK